MTATAAVTGTQVYQMYINASQDKVWEAITTPEIVAAYFRGAQVEGTYEPGTRIRTASADGSQEWGNNTVLEADPPASSCTPGAACMTRSWPPSRKAASPGRSKICQAGTPG
jgi:Activator of Hsp90 ATPase homolog 1-like protein